MSDKLLYEQFDFGEGHITLFSGEIVQCKDCRYCSIIRVAKCGSVYECLRFKRRFNITMHMMPTDFCSKGQRRPNK